MRLYSDSNFQPKQKTIKHKVDESNPSCPEASWRSVGKTCSVLFLLRRGLACDGNMLGQLPLVRQLYSSRSSSSFITEGMPGAMMPDALLILPSFPPTKGVIQVHSCAMCIFSPLLQPGTPGLWLLLQQLQPLGPSRPLVVPCLHLRSAGGSQAHCARLHRQLYCRQDPSGVQGHVQE